MRAIHLYNNKAFLDIPNTEKISIDDLKDIENDSVDTVYIQDLLDTVFPEQQADIIQEIKNKIKNSGIIHIQAPDLKQLCSSVSTGAIDLSLAQMVLYKDRIFTHTAKNIKDILEHNSLIILSQKYINIFEYHFVVKK